MAGRTLVLPGPLERSIVKERGGSLLIEVAEEEFVTPEGHLRVPLSFTLVASRDGTDVR